MQPYLCDFLANFCNVIFRRGLKRVKAGVCVDPNLADLKRIVFFHQRLTCLHSLRHSAEMASSQQPSPTHPSDFLDTPAKISTHLAIYHSAVSVFSFNAITQKSTLPFKHGDSEGPNRKTLCCTVEAVAVLTGRFVLSSSGRTEAFDPPLPVGAAKSPSCSQLELLLFSYQLWLNVTSGISCRGQDALIFPDNSNRTVIPFSC